MGVKGFDFRRVGVEELGLSSAVSSACESSGGAMLESLFKKLDVRETDSLIDIGCGKASALITLRKFPFKRLDGLDISQAVLDVAETNLTLAGMSGRSRLFRADAAEFNTYDDYTYAYMYNPFNDRVMRSVMAEIEKSLTRNPRSFTIVYLNPLMDDVIVNSARFCRVHRENYRPNSEEPVYHRTFFIYKSN